MIHRTSDVISRVLEVIIVACLAVMSILVFGNVVLRYGFDSGIAWSEELSRLLFVWLIFMGAILASKEHIHIGFDSLVRRLPLTGRRIMLTISGLGMLACCAFFVVGGWQQTAINLQNEYPTIGISYGWLYAVAIVFGIGTAISILSNLAAALGHERPTEDELHLTRDIGERMEFKAEEILHRDETRRTHGDDRKTQ